MIETRSAPYHEAGGELLDVHRPARPPGHGAAPTVPPWHGRGPGERDVLAPLAREAAAPGLVVVVPDWRPDAPDGGWGHPRASVRFVRERAGDFGGDTGRIVPTGWSLGAYPAPSAAVRPGLVDGWRPAAAAGIAGRYLWERPETGLRDLREELAAESVPRSPSNWCTAAPTASRPSTTRGTSCPSSAAGAGRWPVPRPGPTTRAWC
ncbi:hypothetical protein CUT44_05625 [Streptomyces carminius]|uniref:Xaa-Pro dipeptidyl-peptidase-like domain-containing protein n=1 Tax=Streptomyces carminius TaxID=2665496 RepID=A0A2M8M4W2_9ACTN|nr:hypothetical protein [Streptomyces carminius]PJE99244.1 hypothetical protein CUT44_05625 [Streptomyces carminius]